MSETISEEDATDLSTPGPPKWNYKNFATVQGALIFVNARFLHAGEISATARSDGTVGMFYFL